MEKSKTLQTILKEMCKRVNAPYRQMDFKKRDWFMEYAWSEKERDSFKRWMVDWLWQDKKRIDDIAAFPHLLKRNKKELGKTVDYFIADFGWKTLYPSS